MIRRLCIHDGKRLIGEETFDTQQEAESWSRGFHAGARQFGGQVHTLDPADPLAVAEFMLDLAMEGILKDPDSGRLWADILRDPPA